MIARTTSSLGRWLWRRGGLPGGASVFQPLSSQTGAGTKLRSSRGAGRRRAAPTLNAVTKAVEAKSRRSAAVWTAMTA